MNILFGTQKPQGVGATVYFVFEGGRVYGAPAAGAHDAKLAYLLKSGQFSGAAHTKSYVNAGGEGESVLFAGLGAEKAFDFRAFKVAAVGACAFAKEQRIESLTFAPGAEEGAFVRVVSEAAGLAAYAFDKYKTQKSEISLKTVCFAAEQTESLQAAAAEGARLARATNIARTLVNEPSCFLTPFQFDKEVRLMGETYGFEVESYNDQQIKEMGMHALYEVGRGSKNVPMFVVCKYRGAPDSDRTIGLVGKGLTFDSGGLNLKTGPNLHEMGFDMAGAAAVVGAMCAMAQAKLPVNVTGFLGLCENMISSHAYKPGDVIDSLSGKTIYVSNTDAEGRLVLADLVYYAAHIEHVTSVTDICTLTGAAMTACGALCAPVMANDQTLFTAIERGSQSCGERIWRMPIFEDLAEKLRSSKADVTNSPEIRYGGMMVGGLFVREFLCKDIPWAHIDIAGAAHSGDEIFGAKGATGYGAQLLYGMVKELAQV